MFLLTIKEVCHLDQLSMEMDRYNIFLTDLRWLKNNNIFVHRFLTFVKLFFGMGILWIFEIISGFLADSPSMETW